jgi:hypothetical protein
MKKSVLMVLAAAMVLLSMATWAGAQGMSPYLIGNWDDDGDDYYNTTFSVTNPLPVPVDVYAFFYYNTYAGGPGQGSELSQLAYCLHNVLGPASKWVMNSYDDLELNTYSNTGTAQFTAFPYSRSGARVVNENTAITGYQTRWVYYETPTETQAPLNAMIFNTLTKTQMSSLAKIGPCFEWWGGGGGGGESLKSKLKGAK